MLDNIVAILVLDESLSVRVQFLQYWPSLLWRAMLQDPLNDPAPVWMCGQAEHLPTERIYDELQGGWLHCFDTFLDHMVAILVLDTLQHIPIQLLDDELLLVQWDGLQGLLDDSAAVHLQG